jgi:hypothetical protein
LFFNVNHNDKIEIPKVLYFFNFSKFLS